MSPHAPCAAPRPLPCRGGTAAGALVRFGSFYNSSPDATEPGHFVYTVGRQPAHYRETFAQGLHPFINPWANIPLDPAALPGIIRTSVGADGIVMLEVPDGFHPFVSKTAVWHGAGAQQAAAKFHYDYEDAVDAAYHERLKE